MIELYCQHCGHHLKIADKHAGQSGTCKNCGKQILVPSAGFEPDSISDPAQKRNDIPYQWIAATAAFVVVLLLGVRVLVLREGSTPAQETAAANSLAVPSPDEGTRTTTPQDRSTSTIAENLSPPTPDFPDFTEGKRYLSRAVDSGSSFTLKPQDLSFTIGERREFVDGIFHIRNKFGFTVAWEATDTFEFQGDTFRTMRQIPGENTSGGQEVFSVLRDDGFYVYHHLDDEAPRYFIKFPLKPGMRWSHDVYHFRKGQGPSEREIVTQFYYADAEETIKTPAGTFRCVRVLAGPVPELSDGPNVITHWYTKGFGHFVQVRIPDGRVFIMKTVTKS